jgi:hypothetical protein
MSTNRVSRSKLMGLGLFAAACLALSSAKAACPAGSQFFGWGNKYGCVVPGENKVVARCLKGTRGRPCTTVWYYKAFEGGQLDGTPYCCYMVK